MDTERIAINLSNSSELGNTLWPEQDKETLWPFVAAVSALLELLSGQMVLEGDNEDGSERDGNGKELNDAVVWCGFAKRLS